MFNHVNQPAGKQAVSQADEQTTTKIIAIPKKKNH
jgi:hypothetical protein